MNVCNLVTRVASALVVFVFLEESARALPPVPVPPPFPVGPLAAYPVVVQPGNKPVHTCAVDLPANAQADDYTFFIREVLLPYGFTWDVQVARTGEMLSPLAIDPGSGRFDL